MKFDNLRKFQGVTANVFFPTMLVFLYHEESYAVLAIYIIFAVWFTASEFAIYSTLIKSNTNGKTYITKTIVLTVLNGILAVLAKTQNDTLYKFICVGFLIYSTWFCFVETKRYYLNNKNLLDKCFILQ